MRCRYYQKNEKYLQKKQVKSIKIFLKEKKQKAKEGPRNIKICYLRRKRKKRQYYPKCNKQKQNKSRSYLSIEEIIK